MNTYYGECESKTCEPAYNVPSRPNPNLALCIEELSMLSIDMQARLSVVLETLVGRADLIDERKATPNADEKKCMCNDLLVTVGRFGYCSKLLSAIQDSMGVN